MAVVHGMKADVFLNGMDAGDWVNSVKTTHSREVLERTVLNNEGYKMYALGLESGNMNLAGFYDSATSAELITLGIVDADTGDAQLNTAYGLETGDVACHFPGGALAAGDRGIGISGFLTQYDIETGSSGLATVNVELQGCVGREDIKLLATKAARTDSFTGTAVDNAASSANGATAYLHVFDHTSGTLPVIVEHSTDNSVWATLGTFTNVTADHKAERIEITGTVNRYVRAAATGTFVSEFAVAVHRKP